MECHRGARHSPRIVVGAKYSGLAECPCSTRRGNFREAGRNILYDADVSNTSGVAYHSGCKPGGSLWKQQNPTCAAATYNGGLQCCHHGMNLLDADLAGR
eukprot:gene19500-biopygen36869